MRRQIHRHHTRRIRHRPKRRTRTRQGIIRQQSTRRRRQTTHKLEHLRRHQRTNHSRRRTQHPGKRTRLNRLRNRRKNITQMRAIRLKKTHRPAKTQNRAPHQRQTRNLRSIRNQILRRKRIRTIHHTIRCRRGEKIQNPGRIHMPNRCLNRQRRAQLQGTARRNLRLRLTHIRHTKKRLTLNIRQLHRIRIHNVQIPHTSRRQSLHHRTTQTTSTNHQHAGSRHRILIKARQATLAVCALAIQTRMLRIHRGRGEVYIHETKPSDGDEAFACSRTGIRPASRANAPACTANFIA